MGQRGPSRGPLDEGSLTHAVQGATVSSRAVRVDFALEDPVAEQLLRHADTGGAVGCWLKVAVAVHATSRISGRVDR
jgi:hypothetical protein